MLAAAWGLAHVPPAPTGLRVGRGYVELCRAELFGLLLVVGIGGAAAIASERQEGTWDALAASPLSDTDLVFGKAAARLLPATMLASLLIPVHLACGVAWGAPWGIIVDAQAIFLGAGVVAAGLGLLCSAVCHRLLHAVALTAAAIILGWFAVLDGLASGWTTTRFARIGHPLRLLDDLVTSSVSVEVAGLRVLAFLLGAGFAGGLGSSPRSDSPDARSREGPWRCPSCFGHDRARPRMSGTNRSTGAKTARAAPAARFGSAGCCSSDSRSV